MKMQNARQMTSHHVIGGLMKSRAHLPADLLGIEAVGKRPLQMFGQPGAGRNHAERIAVQKDDDRVRIGGANGIQAKDMVGRFENPAAARRLRVQMLQKAPVKQERLMMATPVDPVLVGWYAM